MNTLKITSHEVFDDFAELNALNGCADNGDVGLDGFQVDFIINDNYRITYQSEERTNGLKNYAGYEMAHYNENDDSDALMELIDHDYEHEIFIKMEQEAKKMAKVKLEELREQWLLDKGFPEVVGNLEELLEFIKAFSTITEYDQWAFIELERKYPNMPFVGYELDYSSLPTFGGEEPSETSEIWSWDNDSILVGRSADDMEIISR